MTLSDGVLSFIGIMIYVFLVIVIACLCKANKRKENQVEGKNEIK